MTDACVVYLLTGTGHAARLAVSLWSLRKHYSGPVIVYTTQPESHAIGRVLEADRRLRIEHETFPHSVAEKNSTFLTKVALLPHVPAKRAIFLDADTLVVGDISPLMPKPNRDSFHATQFARWHTASQIIQSRVERWRSIEQQRFSSDWYQNLIDDALRPRPAINSGVFGFRPTNPLLAMWNELTMIGRNMFICDEVALQLILHRFEHRVFDCRFNCSPLCSPWQQDPRVWHFHGEKHLANKNALSLWIPAFRECVKNDIGGINAWSPAGDRRLTAYLEKARFRRDRRPRLRTARESQ